MAKPGRPKGSGQGLVLLNCRVEPDLYEAFEAWREQQRLPTGQPLSQAAAQRRLLRWALEQLGTVKELDEVSKGYLEGLLQARADYHEVFEKTWKKLRGER